jgi:apolipoprotein N-acyltransferase
MALELVKNESPLVGYAILGFAYLVPIIAGGVTAYHSRRRQFAAVLALGVTGAILVALINWVGSSVGIASDFPGMASVPLVAALSLLVQVPLVLIGGAVVGLWRRSKHA